MPRGYWENAARFHFMFGAWSSGAKLVPSFVAGVAIYVRHAPARDLIGALAFWSLIAFLVIAYAANVVGPPPPSVGAIASAGLAGGVLFGVWAWWADRHRGTLRQLK